jgi:hypothetical protein
MIPEDLDAEILLCRKTGGDPAAIASLREKIWPLLAERLTVLTSNYWLIDAIISDTMKLFAKMVRDTDEVNWKAWIVAIALSLASERVSATTWLDGLARGLPGEAQERRALVILVILGLNGSCQWALLRGITRSWIRALNWKCEGALKERLATL